MSSFSWRGDEFYRPFSPPLTFLLCPAKHIRDTGVRGQSSLQSYLAREGSLLPPTMLDGMSCLDHTQRKMEVGRD